MAVTVSTTIVKAYPTFSWTHNQQSNFIVVCLALASIQSISVTCGGVPMTLAVSDADNVQTDVKGQVYYLANPPTGNVTISTNYQTRGGCSISLVGVDTSNPLKGTAISGGDQKTVSVVSDVGGMVIDSSHFVSTAPTIPGDQTLLANLSSSINKFTASYKASAGATTNMSRVGGSDIFGFCLASFSPEPEATADNAIFFSHNF